MNTRLAINLKDGTVEVEGSEAFVKEIYTDFKASVEALLTKPSESPAAIGDARSAQDKASEAKVPSSQSTRRPAKRDTAKVRATDTKPTFNSALDLTGLAELYDEFKPENNSETILLFAVFLRDRLGITPCTYSDIYTCFFGMKAKTKIPTAYNQAFHNAQHRTHYIEFSGPEDVRITIAGENFYVQRMRDAKASDT